MKALNAWAIALCSLFLLSSVAYADSRCATANDHLRKIQEIVKTVCNSSADAKDACNGAKQDAKKAEKQIKQFIKVWSKVGGKSWMKIGPRTFRLGGGGSGTIMSPGQRVWVSQNPAGAKATITVSELDGKLDANFNVCSIDKKGNVRWLASKSFSKSKSKEKQVITVKGVKGKTLLVKLATAKPSVGKKLKYKFSSSSR